MSVVTKSAEREIGREMSENEIENKVSCEYFINQYITTSGFRLV